MTGGTGMVAAGGFGHRIAKMSRTAPILAGYLVAGPLLLAAVCVNILSALHDGPPGRPVWRPITWELSSLAALLAVLWVVFAAVKAVTLPTHRWWTAIAVHLAAATLVSAAHCCLMWTLRRAVYTLAGAPYGWSMPLSQILYEYRKDLLTYLVVAVLYWGMRRLSNNGADAAVSAPASPAIAAPAAAAIEPTLDIRDGSTRIRARIAGIVAAEAAGNYVAIVLQDGRKPLMRTTMTRLSSLLTPHGFVRVHRSWVINPDHLQHVTATGAGDYRLALAADVTAPLSRRYVSNARCILDLPAA